jgi:hypothetical protein
LIDHGFLDARRELGLPDEACLEQLPSHLLHQPGRTRCVHLPDQILAGQASISISRQYVHPDKGNLDDAIALLD